MLVGSEKGGWCEELARSLRGACEELLFARSLRGACEELARSLRGACEELARNSQKNTNTSKTQQTLNNIKNFKEKTEHNRKTPRTLKKHRNQKKTRENTETETQIIQQEQKSKRTQTKTCFYDLCVWQWAFSTMSTTFVNIMIIFLTMFTFLWSYSWKVYKDDRILAHISKKNV